MQYGCRANGEGGRVGRGAVASVGWLTVVSRQAIVCCLIVLSGTSNQYTPRVHHCAGRCGLDSGAGVRLELGLAMSSEDGLVLRFFTAPGAFFFLCIIFVLAVLFASERRHCVCTNTWKTGDALQGEAALRGTWDVFRDEAPCLLSPRIFVNQRSGTALSSLAAEESRLLVHFFSWRAMVGWHPSSQGLLLVNSPQDGALLCLRCLFFFIFVMRAHTAIATVVTAGSPRWFCYPTVSTDDATRLVAMTYKVHTKRGQYHRRPFSALDTPSVIPTCAE